ncbi:MAG: glutamate mutase L, partial [Candidatus Adiutrix sp.]|nr:glutamate mutase L [Candidatus Adiutrix sp.]
PGPGEAGRAIDQALAALAVKIGMERHCGSVEAVYTSTGQAWAQTGKDLSNVACVIGTGGPIINAAAPEKALAGAVQSPADLNLLKPLHPQLRVDAKYILSAMGSLSRVEPETALHIMLEELRPDA